MFDNNLNLNLDKYIPNIIEAFTSTFGDEYKSIITERLTKCNIIYYMKDKTYKDYYDFLIKCKTKDLKITFYNYQGLSYDKYRTENSGIIDDKRLDLRTLDLTFDPKKDMNTNKPDDNIRKYFRKNIQKLINSNKSVYKDLRNELEEYKDSIKNILNKKVNTKEEKYKEYTDNNSIVFIVNENTVLYTLKNHGENDLAFLHILCHVISTNDGITGIEPDKVTVIDENNKEKREFELFNEILTDIIADEARSYLHMNYIYMCEEKDKCTRKDSNKHTPTELKDIVTPLVDLIPEELKKSVIENNPSYIKYAIGENNFIRLNELINKTYALINSEKMDIKKYNHLQEEYSEELERIYHKINSVLTKQG